MEFCVDRQLDEQTEMVIRKIIGASVAVHRELGPGFLEKVYEEAMAVELRTRKIHFLTQVPVPIFYRGVQIHGHVLDMIVEERVVIELKSVEKLQAIHEAQILSYLKATKLPVGLVINFKEKLVKDGVKRYVLSRYA